MRGAEGGTGIKQKDQSRDRDKRGVSGGRRMAMWMGGDGYWTAGVDDSMKDGTMQNA